MTLSALLGLAPSGKYTCLQLMLTPMELLPFIDRQIVSGSRDKTIKLWNTLGECKYTIQEDVSVDPKSTSVKGF